VQNVPGPGLESWSVWLQELRHKSCQVPYHEQAQVSLPARTHARHLSSAHHFDTTGCVLLTFLSQVSQSPPAPAKTFTANPEKGP
jgi:hypothetical protein